jgi:glycerol-3-phosphate dehydrogenase subunit B
VLSPRSLFNTNSEAVIQPARRSVERCAFMRSSHSPGRGLISPHGRSSPSPGGLNCLPARTRRRYSARVTSFDVIVIGGGVAGVAAALAARAAGASVAVIRATPGMTAASGGGWSSGPPDQLRVALAACGYVIDAAGTLPHPFGSTPFFPLAEAAHSAGVLRDGLAVCGIVGVPWFRAPMLARLWSHATGYQLHAFELELERTPRAGWSAVSLAEQLDDDPDLLVRPLATALRGTTVSGVVLPSVLGLQPGDRVRTHIAQAIGAPVAEALGVAPSIPGWRLDQALMQCVERAGIFRVDGRVDGSSPGPRVGVINVEAAGQRTSIEAAQYVLATGKFAGGGLETWPVFRERALGCELWLEHMGDVFDAPNALLTRMSRADEQPLLDSGVPVDDLARPLGRGGSVLYENVRVAGALRARDRSVTSGLGEAATEGWAAGTAAASAAAARK